jgi:phosphate-selective porin OprO/OprP
MKSGSSSGFRMDATARCSDNPLEGFAGFYDWVILQRRNLPMVFDRALDGLRLGGTARGVLFFAALVLAAAASGPAAGGDEPKPFFSTAFRDGSFASNEPFVSLDEAAVEQASAVTAGPPVAQTAAAAALQAAPPTATFGAAGLDDQPPDVRTNQRPKPGGSVKPSFAEGFKLQTPDKEFDLVLHSELQLDMRAYGENHPNPVNQFGFNVNRMRLIFNGHLTRPIEYAVSINKGLGSLDLLDAYLNFNYDERLQLRVGRFRVPFTYDWYSQSNQFLLTPERSVFAENYGYSRNLAIMLHGDLLDDHVDYALAAVNGPRNQYIDYNASKDILGYLKLEPFRDLKGFELLENLNVGYSAAYGLENQSPLPVNFRTSGNASQSSGNLEEIPTFLALNTGVREDGTRWMQEVFVAYYYKQLTIQAAWDGGYNDYRSAAGDRVRLPVNGWHAQFGYFLTGEELDRRTFVEPLRPFDLRPGKRGPGAIEIQARYDDFKLGSEVFTGGLADANLYTNQVRTTDVGANWYLNKFVKVYFDWQHAMYSQPVVFAPGKTHRTSDLFWTRLQFNF